MPLYSSNQPQTPLQHYCIHTCHQIDPTCGLAATAAMRTTQIAQDLAHDNCKHLDTHSSSQQPTTDAGWHCPCCEPSPNPQKLHGGSKPILHPTIDPCRCCCCCFLLRAGLLCLNCVCLSCCLLLAALAWLQAAGQQLQQLRVLNLNSKAPGAEKCRNNLLSTKWSRERLLHSDKAMLPAAVWTTGNMSWEYPDDWCIICS